MRLFIWLYRSLISPRPSLIGLGALAFTLITDDALMLKSETHTFSSLWWLLYNHSQNGLSQPGPFFFFKQMLQFQTYSACVQVTNQGPCAMRERGVLSQCVNVYWVPLWGQYMRPKSPLRNEGLLAPAAGRLPADSVAAPSKDWLGWTESPGQGSYLLPRAAHSQGQESTKGLQLGATLKDHFSHRSLQASEEANTVPVAQLRFNPASLFPLSQVLTPEAPPGVTNALQANLGAASAS